MQAVEIESVSHLIKYLESKDFVTTFDIERSEKLLFRGQGNSNFKLIPSIGREPKGCIVSQLVWFEKDIYEDARNAFPDFFDIHLKPIDFLAKLQHHGIPTRLLDVTENPLVALYFACCDEELRNYDGELFVFKNIDERPTYNAIIEAIADTAFIPADELNEFLKVAMLRKYFNNERWAVKKQFKLNPEYGSFWIRKCCETPIYINRAILTTRQRSQNGKFLLFPNHIEKNEIVGKNRYHFSDYLEPIDKNDKNMVMSRFIISKDCKKEILRQLDVLGINRKTLFADSIDVVCAQIKAYYGDRFNGKDFRLI